MFKFGFWLFVITSFLTAYQIFQKPRWDSWIASLIDLGWKVGIFAMGFSVFLFAWNHLP